MKKLYKHIGISGIAALALFMANCAGSPESNQMLNEAQSAYQQAEQDTLVVKNAPVALQEAEESVTAAQKALKKGKKEAIVNHQAYMAQQRVKIARQTAMLNAAQDEVKRAQNERQKVVIEARKAEADASQRKAEQAQDKAEVAQNEAEQQRAEAETAKKEAMAAQQRAEELASRIDELKAEKTARGLVLTLGDVLFDVDKANLKPGGQQAVTQLSSFLQEYTNRNVQIEGHTDNTGSDSYNQKLSEQRANAVKQALIADGISGSRIKTVGLGEQYPVVTNNTSAGRQQNRRVEVIISDKNGNIKPRQQ